MVSYFRLNGDSIIEKNGQQDTHMAMDTTEIYRKSRSLSPTCFNPAPSGKRLEKQTSIVSVSHMLHTRKQIKITKSGRKDQPALIPLCNTLNPES